MTIKRHTIEIQAEDDKAQRAAFREIHSRESANLQRAERLVSAARADLDSNSVDLGFLYKSLGRLGSASETILRATGELDGLNLGPVVYAQDQFNAALKAIKDAEQLAQQMAVLHDQMLTLVSTARSRIVTANRDLTNAAE